LRSKRFIELFGYVLIISKRGYLAVKDIEKLIEKYDPF